MSNENSDLKNEVERLQERIADLEAANRWIPVKERLPEENDLVLVFNEFGAVDMAYFRGGFKTFGAVIVTHWRPQPATPQATQS